MEPKIAIVNSSSFGKVFPEHLEKLKHIGEVVKINVPMDISEETLIEKLKGVHGIIATVTPKYTRKLFENLKELVVISRHGIDVDNIDISAATNAGIIVCKASGEIVQEASAEHTIALILGVCRKLFEAYSYVVEGVWGKRTEFVGCELKNKKIGLIGIGTVGKRVAEILSNGFNAKVFAFDPSLGEEEIRKRGAIPIDLQKLLKSCDIISLHCPLNQSTYHMLGEEEFSIMKDSIILINTSRGELIKEKSLIEALKSGKIRGYGADAVERDSIQRNHPLLKFKNVLVTPYIALYTHESLGEMGKVMIDNMENVFLKNKNPENIVNPEVQRRKLND